MNTMFSAADDGIMGMEGMRMPVGHSPPGTRQVPKELIRSLREEFKRLIKGDDFLENLAQIESLTQATRAVVTAINGQSMPNYGRRHHVGIPMSNPYSPIVGQNPEQFGARAIRELVNLIPDVMSKLEQAKQPKQSPASLVEAIATAKTNGLTELATKLESQLLGGAMPVAAPWSLPKPSEPKPNGKTNGKHKHTNGVST